MNLDPAMKLFGVLLTVLVLLGALVGGVVGVLLPKISTGLSLGVLLSLFFGVVRLFFKLFLEHVCCLSLLCRSMNVQACMHTYIYPFR